VGLGAVRTSVKIKQSEVFTTPVAKIEEAIVIAEPVAKIKDVDVYSIQEQSNEGRGGQSDNTDSNIQEIKNIAQNALRVAQNAAVNAMYGGGGDNNIQTGDGTSNFQHTNGASPHDTPILGDEWFDTNSDILYKFVSDGTSNIWVDISSFSTFNTGTSGANIIDELNDVIITTPAIGDTLTFNGTNWVNIPAVV